MTGAHAHAVAERREPLQRAEEIFGALARGDREVGPRRGPDEQRVAGEHELVIDDECAVLRAVPGRVQHADAHRADLDDLPVLERLVRVLGLRDRRDRDGQTVLERETAVAADVVGVRVRLEHALDAHALLLGGLEILLDREGGVDDDGDGGLSVTHQIRGATQILVHELPEQQHGA